MRNFILLFTFLAGSFGAGLQAQSDESHSGHSFDLRLYGGYNVVQLSTDGGTQLIDNVLHRERVSGRPGLQLGVMGTFGHRFYIQPGFQYTTVLKDFILISEVDDTELVDKTTISMASVPLRVGLKLINPDDENIFNVRVFGGIEGHHILSVNHDEKSGAQGDINEDDFTNLVVNGDFGMGVDVLFLYLDLGYQLGFSSILSDSDVTADAFYVNLGLKIGF